VCNVAWPFPHSRPSRRTILGMDERALGIRLRVYEYIGTLLCSMLMPPRVCFSRAYQCAEDAGTCTYWFLADVTRERKGSEAFSRLLRRGAVHPRSWALKRRRLANVSRTSSRIACVRLHNSATARDATEYHTEPGNSMPLSSPSLAFSFAQHVDVKTLN